MSHVPVCQAHAWILGAAVGGRAVSAAEHPAPTQPAGCSGAVMVLQLGKKVLLWVHALG